MDPALVPGAPIPEPNAELDPGADDPGPPPPVAEVLLLAPPALTPKMVFALNGLIVLGLRIGNAGVPVPMDVAVPRPLPIPNPDAGPTSNPVSFPKLDG